MASQSSQSSRQQRYTLQDQAFSIFLEFFPDLTLEPLPFSTNADEATWKIYSKWGCWGVGGREFNTVLMRWDKHSDSLALRRNYEHVLEFKSITNFERAIREYFPETNNNGTWGASVGEIVFIVMFPDGKTLVRRAEGYHDDSSSSSSGSSGNIFEFPYFSNITWAEFLLSMHNIGGTTFTIDTDTNTDVMRLEYGRNDFAAIMHINNIEPPTLIAHLMKNARLGGTYGVRHYRDEVYTAAMGDARNMTPETAYFIHQRMEYSGRPKRITNADTTAAAATTTIDLKPPTPVRKRRVAEYSDNGIISRHCSNNNDGTDDAMMSEDSGYDDRDTCCRRRI